MLYIIVPFIVTCNGFFGGFSGGGGLSVVYYMIIIILYILLSRRINRFERKTIKLVERA